MRSKPVPEIRDDFVRSIGRWIPGDDPVVVGGKALDLHHRLMAAGCAAVEVRAFGKAPGVTADDQLAGFGHHMNRPVAPVDDFFGMSLAERQVVDGVSGVCRRGRVAAPHTLSKRAITDRAGKSPGAHTLELAVPGTALRDPDLEVDPGIARRRRDSEDAAK